jgi:hypothetical protein
LKVWAIDCCNVVDVSFYKFAFVEDFPLLVVQHSVDYMINAGMMNLLST